MARREYRDPTGKLKGYSQTDTDRTGGKGAAGKILAYLLLAGMLFPYSKIGFVFNSTIGNGIPPSFGCQKISQLSVSTALNRANIMLSMALKLLFLLSVFDFNIFFGTIHVASVITPIKPAF